MMLALYIIGFVAVIPIMLWIIYTDNHRITVGDLVVSAVVGLVPVLNILMAIAGIVLMFVYYAIVLFRRMERSDLMNKRIL